MVPTWELPPPTPFTCQVTAVFVVAVLLERLTTATRVIEVLRSALADAGEIVTEVTVALPPLPPPQADSVKAIARASKEVHRADILILRISRSMLTFCNLIFKRALSIPLFLLEAKKFLFIFCIMMQRLTARLLGS